MNSLSSHVARDNFTKVRFYLDNKIDKSSMELHNVVNFAFRYLWVIDSSDDEATATVSINSKDDAGDGIPVKKGMNFDLGGIASDCVFEWGAQAGKWIDVIFSKIKLETSVINLSTTQNSSLSDGSNYNHDNISLDSTVKVLVPSDGQRTVTTISNKSPETIYVGTLANCGHVDYAKKCMEIGPGDTFLWRNTAGLYCRLDDTKTTDLVVVWNEVL